MKCFTTPNSKNIIATLRIVTTEKSELTLLFILCFHAFIFIGSHNQFEKLMLFLNTISMTIKYIFTQSKQTVSFMDVKAYLYESRKRKTKLYKKPTECMALLYFHSHHLLSFKEGIIYLQALQYNMHISEDHILQKELTKLTLLC